MQSKVLKLNQRFDELYNELILREMARRRIFWLTNLSYKKPAKMDQKIFPP